MPENFERGPSPSTPESMPDPTEDGAMPEVGDDSILEGGKESGVGIESEGELKEPAAEFSLEENAPELGDGDVSDVAEDFEEKLPEKHEDSEEQEDSGEAQEKRRRVEAIRERVATGFESAKERMTAMEQRYDGIFQRGRETLGYLKEEYPQLVSDAGLERLDEANERVKERFGNMQDLYDGGSERLQSMIQSFPAEFVSNEQIEMLEMQIDRLFETMDQGESMIEDRLDNVEMKVNALPSVTQEGRFSKREAKEAGEQLKDSGLLDEGEGEDLDLGRAA